ncbi:MAG TPA: hypothetical protein VNO81_11430 [Candidatus Nitrosotenuis sp.]|nr:hypothetical protein [Candidatus Nitrosotenuis sp.]
MRSPSHRLYLILHPGNRGGLLYYRREGDGGTLCRGPLEVGGTYVRYLVAFHQAGGRPVAPGQLARLAAQGNPALVATDLHRVVRPAHERLGLGARPAGRRQEAPGPGGRGWGGIACLPDGSYRLLAWIRLLDPADPQDRLEMDLLELLARHAA